MLSTSHARRLDVHHDQSAARSPVHRGHGQPGKQGWQHRNGEGSAFCKRYKLTRLVYAEEHASIQDAIVREKAMKAWKRDWKIELVEQSNPQWLDLWDLINA